MICNIHVQHTPLNATQVLAQPSATMKKMFAFAVLDIAVQPGPYCCRTTVNLEELELDAASLCPLSTCE